MSLPNIPDIRPFIDLNRKDVVNLLLASIALEEIALAHVTNAEAEKIQEVLKCNPTIEELLEINDSVNHTLENVIKKEMLLHFQIRF